VETINNNQKGKNGRKTPTGGGLSPRNREACHSIGTPALILQSITKIGTQVQVPEEQQKDVAGIIAAQTHVSLNG
jgi:hypothetical protein